MSFYVIILSPVFSLCQFYINRFFFGKAIQVQFKLFNDLITFTDCNIHNFSEVSYDNFNVVSF